MFSMCIYISLYASFYPYYLNRRSLILYFDGLFRTLKGLRLVLHMLYDEYVGCSNWLELSREFLEWLEELVILEIL